MQPAKSCSKCGELKSLEDFSPNKKMRDGRQSSCRDCSAAQLRRYRKDHPDKAKEADARHRATVRHGDYRREQRLRTVYGLTVDDYNAMLDRQNGTCAICDGPPKGPGSQYGRFRFHVDHCHETNKVRGLLCGNCNTAIGLLGDDLKRFWAAIDYLEG